MKKTPEKAINIALKTLITLAYEKHGKHAFSNCGSNGGDMYYYHYNLSDEYYISFCNHGYIDMHGLDIEMEHTLYKPKLRKHLQ